MNELWERLDPGFLAPIWLGVGAIAVIAVCLLEIGARRRRRQALRLFASPHLVPGLTGSLSRSNRMLKRVLLITAVGLLFVAMARPHLFFKWNEEDRTGLDILLAIDCSKSMLTEDVRPDRLDRAKLAVEDFAEHLPNNRLGLIAFAGDAFLQCPLTLDHDAFLSALRDLDTDTIPRPGTDIATAIDQAVTALKSQPNNLKFLILVTDGEDLEGRVLDSARAAAQTGLKVYTVGVGTPEGGEIPLRDDLDQSGGITGGVSYLHDQDGQIVHSRLDEQTLRQIAEITGGAYEPLGQRGEGLETIYDRYIAPLPKQHLEARREKVQFERFEWPLALATLLLIWEFLVGERTRGSVETPPPLRATRRRTEAAVPLVLTALLLGAGMDVARAAATETAERDYKSGQYEDSAQKYGEALETEPNRPDLQYDRGDAAYRAGDYTEAEEAFRKALETPDLKLQEKTYYNLGNAQFKDGEGLEKVDQKRTQHLWEGAVHSYESALKLRNSADTKYNYEVVKKKLEQLKQQEQQQQNNSGNSQQNQDQSNQSSSSGSDQQGQGGQNQQQEGGQDRSQQQGNSAEQDSRQNSKTAGAQQRAHSGERAQDEKDPQIKSREEAEALLDSLKDDEHRVSARSLNGDNEPPPTASGKDW